MNREDISGPEQFLSLTIFAPEVPARSGVRVGPQAITRSPKAGAHLATAVPVLPRPRIPRVFPSSSIPGTGSSDAGAEPVSRNDSPCEGNNESKDILRYRSKRHRGRHRHDNSQFGGGLYINTVRPGGHGNEA